MPLQIRPVSFLYFNVSFLFSMSLFCIQCLLFVFNVPFLYSMSLLCMQCLLFVFSVFACLSCELMVLISNLCRCRYDALSLLCIQSLSPVFNVSFLYLTSVFCVRRCVLRANGFDRSVVCAAADMPCSLSL